MITMNKNEVVKFLEDNPDQVAIVHFNQDEDADCNLISFEDYETHSWHECSNRDYQLEWDAIGVLVNKAGKVTGIDIDEFKEILLLNPFIGEGDIPDYDYPRLR